MSDLESPLESGLGKDPVLDAFHSSFKDADSVDENIEEIKNDFENMSNNETIYARSYLMFAFGVFLISITILLMSPFVNFFC